LGHANSVLLLGEPGSGKSLTLYEVAVALQDTGRKPIPIRAIELDSFLRTTDWTELGSDRLDTAVFLLDGLDEAVDQLGGGELEDALKYLSHRAPLLVTSRAREYEDILAFSTEDVGFDDVLVLQPWDVDVEFANYLSRLSREGLVQEPQLYRTVVASERLSRLVSRPLYARMLTFIGDGDAHRVLDTASLYGEYLARLSRTTDVSMRRTRRQTPLALPTWQAIARHIHLTQLSPDAVPMAAVESALSTEVDLIALRRIMDQIIDRRLSHGQEVGEFIHYSFYEYLLACAVRQELAETTTVAEAVRVLKQDLTREVRHHLIGQLRGLGGLAEDWLTDRLSRLYKEVRAAATISEPDRLAVCNLLVYVISRASPRASKYLPQLLENENDAFLLQSILWALCHIGWRPALDEFFDRLESDETFRAQCRGYYLYYYGDLDERGPPFFDRQPFVAHKRASSRGIALLASAELQDAAPELRCADIYVFTDITLVRSELIAGPDGRVLRAAFEALRKTGIPQRIMDRLGEMVRAATQPT
jgi:hypothetical protein